MWFAKRLIPVNACDKIMENSMKKKSMTRNFFYPLNTFKMSCAAFWVSAVLLGFGVSSDQVCASPLQPQEVLKDPALIEYYDFEDSGVPQERGICLRCPPHSIK